MRLSIGSETAAIDVTLNGAGDDSTTLSDLAGAAGIAEWGTNVAVDGRRHRTTETLAAVALCDGSVIEPWVPPPPAPVVAIDRIAGPGSGESIRLAPGAYDIGPEASPEFRVAVRVDGTSTITPLDRVPITVDGKPTDATPNDAKPNDEAAPATGAITGTVVGTAAAVYRIAPLTEVERKPGVRQGGRVLFARPPRLTCEMSDTAVDAPAPPAGAHNPQPLSWIMILAPIPFGIVMAVLFSPFFLAFTLMSPVMTLARWWDGRRRARKDRIRIVRESAERLTEFGDQLRQLSLTTADQKRQGFRCPAQLLRIATAGRAGLWEVRPAHDDFLEVVVGIGRRSWTPRIERHETIPGVDAVIERDAVLQLTPITVDLATVSAIGIAGDLGTARRVAAGIVQRLTARHGPADIEVTALLDRNTVGTWDWMKWLPHLHDGAGRRRLALDDSEARDLLARPVIPADRRSRHDADRDDTARSVLVVDGQCHLDGRVPALGAHVNRDGAVAVVVADRIDHLPSFCGATITVDRSGRAKVTDVASGRANDDVLAVVAEPGVVARTARAMARFVDPEATDEAALLPDRCRLTELSPVGSSGSEVLASWASPPPGLIATIGVGPDGPLRIDLVGDGPHALIAGTTGSGKSELLRTIVVSLAATYRPDAVTFVLVDFKGGGAFDACADLPHTVGVVTDLDEHLAARALRCLKAELRYRERRLRAAGVSDLQDLPDDATPLPRLVIVVDEFATLAAELPDFMASLVDVAQRGRSLGIHMILATQRPTGVVDAKIRANTNLRIALRVQDDGDSNDVIGSAAAATISRTQPGRAFARFGASELVAFQAAIVSLAAPPHRAHGVTVEPFELAGEVLRPVEEFDGPEDIRVISDEIRSATVALALPAPRVPWPPPLPDRVALADLASPPPSMQRWSAPIGLVDRPDEQRLDVASWDAECDGNTLIYGLDTASTSMAVRAICVSLADRLTPAELHLYAVDFVGNLSDLGELPHTGACIGPDEDERLHRLLDRLERELDRRRAHQREHRLASLGPQDAPLIVLAVANFAGLLEHFDEHDDLDSPTLLTAIVRDGPALGMHVIATSNTERGVPMKLAGMVATKFVMRLADPMAYSMFGLKLRDVPDLGPGRAIDARNGREVHIADATAAALTVSGIGDDIDGPAPLETLPTRVHLSDLNHVSAVAGDRWRLAIGRSFATLDPSLIDLRAGLHVVVAGGPESGRTTTLRTLASTVGAAAPEMFIGRIGFDGPGVALDDPADLDALGGEAGVVLVDDVETVRPDLLAAIERLAGDPRTPIRIVLAGRVETFATMQPLIRSVTAGRTGILLRPGANAGDVFRMRLPGKGAYPAGRGFVVTAGVADLAQIAIADEPQGSPVADTDAAATPAASLLTRR